MLGAPVGGVDCVGLQQEGRHRGEFDREMRRVLDDAAGSRVIDHRIQLILQMAAATARPCAETVARVIAVAHAEGVLQDGLYLRSSRPMKPPGKSRRGCSGCGPLPRPTRPFTRSNPDGGTKNRPPSSATTLPACWCATAGRRIGAFDMHSRKRVSHICCGAVAP